MELVRQEMDLVSIAPLHVGNGTTLRAYEYLFDKRQKAVLFLHEPKWIAFLARHDLMDDFVRYIEETARALKSRGNFRGQYLWDYLRGKGIAEREIRSLAIRRAEAPTDSVQKSSANDIVLQAALADGRPYIPGSTIKGALRTGLLHRWIREHRARGEEYWRELSCAQEAGRPQDVEREWRQIVQRMETEALHQLGANEKRGDAVNSALRGLRVSDAIADERDTVILQKVDATPKPNRFGKTEHTISLFRECIPAGRRLRFSVTADFSMLEKLGLASLSEVFDAARAYAQEGLKLQREVFGSYGFVFDEADGADLLLGGGTGFLSKTLVYALAPSEKAARDFVARLLDQKFYDKQAGPRMPKHKHVVQDTVLSPRTLKLAARGLDTWILGLCRIEEARPC